MKTLNKLLEQNRAWAEQRREADAGFFERLSSIQRPDYLWIGCSDSRVPANQIVGLDPGELFVHRNVANIIAAGDANCMAVVQYAVDALAVQHIIVCGHYGCGGVRAALENRFDGAWHVERWLSPLLHIASAHAAELSRLATHQEQWDRLCEINVVEQVQRLVASDVVSLARSRGVPVRVHGLIYSIRDGLLQRVTSDLPAGVG